jgi:hypothetical protein
MLVDMVKPTIKVLFSESKKTNGRGGAAVIKRGNRCG